MTLRPLGKTVLFQFLDETYGTSGRFMDRVTPAGIKLLPTNDRQKIARWGKVVSVGPEVLDLVAGDYILITALMWTYGAKLNDTEKVWKTEEAHVLAVTNDLDACGPQ